MGRAGRVFGGGTDPVSVHYRAHKAAIKARTMQKYGSTSSVKVPSGMTDVQARGHAGAILTQYGVHSPEFVDATTFINKAGDRITKGSFQVLGFTLSSLQGLTAPLPPPIQPTKPPSPKLLTGRLPIQSGFATPSMGGMGRGEWERSQKKKEEENTGAAGLGTVVAVVAVGGVGYLLWSLLK